MYYLNITAFAFTQIRKRSFFMRKQVIFSPNNMTQKRN